MLYGIKTLEKKQIDLDERATGGPLGVLPQPTSDADPSTSNRRLSTSRVRCDPQIRLDQRQTGVTGRYTKILFPVGIWEIIRGV